MTPLARAADRSIEWYQSARAGRASPCRFTPSCSVYTRTAIGEYGAVRGLAMGTWRILRCNPLGGKGHDPVPARRST